MGDGEFFLGLVRVRPDNVPAWGEDIQGVKRDKTGESVVESGESRESKSRQTRGETLIPGK